MGLYMVHKGYAGCSAAVSKSQPTACSELQDKKTHTSVSHNNPLMWMHYAYTWADVMSAMMWTDYFVIMQLLPVKG